jgi:VIT1/CCC1 family predicted Fe2+/Mn2+ transporter
MPQTEHVERHFTASAVVRDVVIGMADGLTVPFALAAGMAGVVGDRLGLIVVAGLAEIAAGSIAMGLGGYLAARGDREHYEKERSREQREVRDIPAEEASETAGILQSYGLSPEETAPIVEALKHKPDAWVDFMMRFELGLEQPDPKRAVRSAGTIAASYVLGGLVPLAPYMLAARASTAFIFSVVVTLIALGVFGYIKGHFTGTGPGRSAFQTVVTGGLAAMAAYLLASAFSPGM